jgi:hypothetical protein
MPSAVRPQDKTERSGGSRVAKNVGVVDRIDPVQAAPLHRSSFVGSTASKHCRPGRSRRAQDTERGGHCKHDESRFSNHGVLLLGCQHRPSDILGAKALICHCRRHLRQEYIFVRSELFEVMPYNLGAKSIFQGKESRYGIDHF